MRTERRTKTGGTWGERATGVSLAVLVSAGVALAQRGLPARPFERQPQPRLGGQLQPKLPPVRVPGDQHQHAPGFLKRLRDLPPEEQEQILANDERFHRLPPDRQTQVRERLQRWNTLTPEEKQRIREREEIFESLSPEQRQQARQLFQQWQQLPPQRRGLLMNAFRHLRALPPRKRAAFMAGSKTAHRFSPEERDLLEGLSRLLPGE